jgi:uncharacterized membrane protein
MNFRKYITKDLLILVIPLLAALIAYPFLPAHLPKLLFFLGVQTAYMPKEIIFFFAILPFAFYEVYRARK